MRRVDDTLVVNVGAVGLPFDGDRRASYGRMTWDGCRWQAEIVRLTYDWQRTERAFDDEGFLEGGGPLVRLHLAELREARSQLFSWMHLYEEDIRAGRITVADAVDRWLAR